MMMITSVALWISAPLAPARAASSLVAITVVFGIWCRIDRVAAVAVAAGVSSTAIDVVSAWSPVIACATDSGSTAPWSS